MVICDQGTCSKVSWVLFFVWSHWVDTQLGNVFLNLCLHLLFEFASFILFGLILFSEFVKYISKIETIISGNSLVVQWLELGTSIAWGMDSIPGQGTKIPHALRCSQKQNFYIREVTLISLPLPFYFLLSLTITFCTGFWFILSFFFFFKKKQKHESVHMHISPLMQNLS